MESCQFPRTPPLIPPSISWRNKSISQFPIIQTKPKFYQNQPYQLSAALKSPKGFGISPKKKGGKVKKESSKVGDKKDELDGGDEGEDEGVIPEVVTSRMMSRMGLSVGIPLFVGLLFFPLFYYLKVGLKIDVPTWVPFMVSFFFFGSALLGVSYGIVSSSWDPMREGSLLGWNEAKRNWPVFWQSLRGAGGRSGNKN